MKKIFACILACLTLVITATFFGCSNNKNPNYETIDGVKHYYIKIGESENGRLEVEGDLDKSPAGEQVTINIIPEDRYFLNYLILNGERIDGVTGATYTFTMPEKKVTVKGYFSTNQKHNITVASTQNGKIELSSYSALAGDRITLTVTPDLEYELNAITFDVEGVVLNGSEFIMPDSDLTVSATFKRAERSLTIAPCENGSVTADKTVAVVGEKVNLTIAPEKGYKLAQILINDVEISLDEDNCFVMINEDAVIKAVFEKQSYTVKVFKSQGGMVTTNKTTANYGDIITVTVTPESGYFYNLTTSPEVVIENNTFTMPASDVTITVTFSKTLYTIVKSTAVNGTFSVNFESAVEGAKIILSCTPDIGYSFLNYTVDGVAQTSNEFTMPAHNVTIGVNFVKNVYSVNCQTVEGGKITASVKSAGYGDEITLTVTPNTGYKLKSLSVNNGAITVTDNKFTMPAGNVTVSAVFEKIPYTITINTATGGTVVASKTTATVEEIIKLTPTAETGYKFKSYSVKCGSTDVTVTDNNFVMPAGNVTISAVFEKIAYTVTVSSVTGGTIKADKSNANYGDTITLTVTPNTGYKLKSLSVNNGAVEVSNNSFTMPNGNVTVTAVFEKIAYTITIASATGGSVTANKTTANFGDTITLTVTPNIGYRLKLLSVNNGAVESANNSFTMPNGNVTVTAVFEKIAYTITIASATGGSVTASKTTANYGDTITLTVTPNTGYRLKSITATGATISSNAFTMPAQNVTVTAVFEKIAYTITIASATGGSVTASKTTANYGDTITLTVTPNTGYRLKSITATGATISSNAFSMPAQNVTVTAVFEKIAYTITLNVGSNGKMTASKTSANYGDKITLTVTPNSGYKATVTSSQVTISNNSFTMPASNVTVTATFNAINYTITVNSATGGSITANKTSATIGTTITLSNTANAGYLFSSYKVNGTSQTTNTFTMPASNVTIDGVFVKGIGNLSNFNFAKNLNYGSSTTGTISTNGNAVTSTQTGYPFVYSEAVGDFYYETNVTFAKSDIKNNEQSPKCGIAINYGYEWMYFYVDALANGWNNGGYGNNTWVIATNGRGELGSGIEWYWADIQERKYNFNKNYANETTFKFGVLKIGPVYKFFINNALAFNLWLPEMNDAVNIGILSFNMTYRCTGTKLGNNAKAITNAKAYFGLTNNQNPTTVTLDGFAGDWKENALTTYGLQSDLKYFYASAFKGSNDVYVIVKARTANYITSSANWWENTNIELRYQSGDAYQMCASADGQKLHVTDAIFNDKVEGALHTITIELKIPLSLWSGTPTLGFAFRSEDYCPTMCEGNDAVWWCGMTHINAQNFQVGTKGLNITREVTPTEKSIRTGIARPDPFILVANGKYYLYGTGSVIDYDVFESTDLNNWTNKGKIFYAKTDTSNPSNTFAVNRLWAPEVVYNPNTKKYVMFYSGYLANSGDNCFPKIGVATSNSPLGPFVDVWGAPLLFPNENKATMDGSCFIDDNGNAYLYYCLDVTRNYIENYRNGVGWNVSQTWVVKLDSTYTKVVGTPTLCVTPDQDWEFNEPGTYCWNEGPYVMKHNGFYFLTYSANPAWNTMYGVGLAYSKSPMGPFVKYKNNPIVKGIANFSAGTGHSMFFKDLNGKLWCSFHTIDDPSKSYSASNWPSRSVLISRVWFKDGIPKIEYSR